MLLIPLASLKAQLMPPAAVARTDLDSALGLIGLGVALKFENYLNRKLAYAEDAEFTWPANHMSFVVPRYPIVGDVTAVLQPSGGGSTSDITSSILQLDREAGLVHFGRNVPGSADDRVTLTYTGGFWIPTGEEGDMQPEGSTELPDDLKLAFAEQCRAVAQAQGIFHTMSMGDASSDNRVISREIKLLDDVLEVLGQYRRY